MPLGHDDILVVHDDQQGMYLPARLAEDGTLDVETPAPPPGRARFARLNLTGARSGVVTALVIPAPSSIMVTLYEVLAGAERWLKDRHRFLQARTRFLRPILIRRCEFRLFRL